MPNGGSDSCGTCPFNGMNEGATGYPPEGATGFFCEIRGFAIEDPFWTYCNNHPRRNPLMLRAPRGPVWAPVSCDLDSRAFSGKARVPPALVPPQGDAMYARVPYYTGTRPNEDEAGECIVCGGRSEETISLPLPECAKKSFCSVAHYLEWWLASSPEAKPYVDAFEEKPPDAASVVGRLEAVAARLGEARSAARSGDRAPATETLTELDEVLTALSCGCVDLMHAAVYLEEPQLRGDLSPHLLALQIGLARAGDMLQQERLGLDEFVACLSGVEKSIGDALAAASRSREEA